MNKIRITYIIINIILASLFLSHYLLYQSVGSNDAKLTLKGIENHNILGAGAPFTNLLSVPFLKYLKMDITLTLYILSFVFLMLLEYSIYYYFSRKEQNTQDENLWKYLFIHTSSYFCIIYFFFNFKLSGFYTHYIYNFTLPYSYLSMFLIFYLLYINYNPLVELILSITQPQFYIHYNFFQFKITPYKVTILTVFFFVWIVYFTKGVDTLGYFNYNPEILYRQFLSYIYIKFFRLLSNGLTTKFLNYLDYIYIGVFLISLFGLNNQFLTYILYYPVFIFFIQMKDLKYIHIKTIWQKIYIIIGLISLIYQFKWLMATNY
jgi:hypothetical protein